MENGVNGICTAGEPYDYRKYDRVWQRVAPSMSPWPADGMAAQGEPATAMCPVQSALSEPGAQADPCCMGSAAAEMLAVLAGFIEEELADRRHYLAFAQQAPSCVRQTMRRLAAEEGEHARKLMAAYYLITGRCYQPHVSCDRVYIGAYCPALRERYHAEACGGFNYLRAADGTTDPCLTELLTELSKDEYRHAATVMELLESALGKC